MRTLVFATQKGGSGKSTLAAAVAQAARRAGRSVRLVETDPQGTLSSWRGRRPGRDLAVDAIHDTIDIEPHLQQLQSQAIDIAIVDTSAGMTAVTRTAIMCADLCLVPSRPSIADIEAAAATLRVIKAARRPFAFILNQVPSRGERRRHSAGLLCESANSELAEVLAQPFIASRIDHQDALAAGLTAAEYAPDGKAADEIRGLWSWIERRLHRLRAVDVSCTSMHLRAATSPVFQRRSGGWVEDEANVPWDSCL